MTYKSKLRPILVLLFFVSVFSLSQAHAEDEAGLPVEVQADNLNYLRDEKKIIAEGNVSVRYKNIRLSSQTAHVYTDSKTATAAGHVRLTDGTSSLVSDTVDYDFANHSGKFPDAKIYQFPWYAQGEEINQLSKQKIEVFDGTITTCDYEDPHYDIKAKKTTIYPGQKIILRSVTIRVLGTPVFWIPYLNIPSKGNAPLEIVVGHSSELGYYVRTAKGIAISDEIEIKPHYDYFSKRGHGFGLDVNYDVPNFGSGDVRMYGIEDSRSPDYRRQISATPFRNTMTEERGRLSIRHRTDFPDGTHLFVNWNELSDEFFLQTFFEEEDRQDTQPASQIILTHNWPGYGITLEVRKRANRFFNVNETLPKLRFTGNNKRLFKTDLFYKHEEEATHFNRKAARSSDDQDVTRLNTFHELSYPFRFEGFKFLPFVNLREDYYSKQANGSEHHTRFRMGGGMEVRSRFYRLYDVEKDLMGVQIHKLRHSIEPIVRYETLRSDTMNQEPNRIFIMDGTDSLTIQDKFRFGFKTRLQTKRMDKVKPVKVGASAISESIPVDLNKKEEKLERVELVSYAQFLTYSMHDRDFDGHSQFTDWEHLAQFRPYDWLRFEFESTYNFSRKQIRDIVFDLILENDKVRFMLSYADSLDINSVAPEREQVVMDLEYQLNNKWKFGGYLRYEFSEEDPLQEWEVRAERDLHDFTLLFGYNQRLSEIRLLESHAKEIFVEFKMKAFPVLSLGSGNRAIFSRPRIGERISGADLEPRGSI